ncbi:MAG: NAD/NADP octopine/nopaline dehydrogenase family protein [Bacteroidaceae bacterium]|nr:NAD/NADP octopine/nopaline dehydrogenase family protein [Bacteroidaceae bacterium]
MTGQKICICGGGNLAHVVGGYLAAKPEFEVRLLTRHPERWQQDRSLKLTDINGKTFNPSFAVISSDPAQTVLGADIIILCLPGFAIAQVLESIKGYIGIGTTTGSVVSSTGFFLMAQKILPAGTRLFGFQRVPFIARINEYGKSATLLGYKPSLAFATMNVMNPQELGNTLSRLFDVPTTWLDNYLKVTLSNSNPLLHPSRLYGLFGGGRERFDRPVLFYEEWDDLSSQTLIDCDNEFRILLDKLGITTQEIVPILDYYESHDARSLTDKIKSIKAFKGLLAPMIQMPDGTFAPDWNNRYFTEDIPYGLLIVKIFASKYEINTPTIDRVLEWAQSGMGKQYIIEGNPFGIGKDYLNLYF